MSHTPTLLRTVKADDKIEGIFLLENVELGTTKGGSFYLKGSIGDASCKMPFRKWQTSEIEANLIGKGGFFFIEGKGQDYNGNMQISMFAIDAKQITPAQEDLNRLVPTTSRDIEKMFAYVEKTLDSIENNKLNILCKAYLADKTWMQQFRVAPAASRLHHAFVGGLLEHTATLIELAERTLPLYPDLNRDIVITGLFIHDLAKCQELTYDMGSFGYSLDGQLVGHIGRGVVLLHEKATTANLPKPLLLTLEHIIFSHHGKMEYGALKTPATPEALFISQLDDLDAKLRLVLDAANRQDTNAHTENAFTDRLWALDNTSFWRADPTKV